MLTRSQMEEVIRDGGSVLISGRIITRMGDLPTDAELAVGNPEQEAVAAAALEAQIAALQAQHARLTQSRTVRTAPAPEATPPASAAEPTQETKEPPPAPTSSSARRDEPTKRGR